uniref:NADH-ubiquinone oxidoreductase chain 5 n=1 Tax=Dermestes peruvianus TaxID=295668 RepID=S4SUY0_DERPE|nr:NADH dehydrogenase subunit 5 [Dermestes peruvianus]
MIICMYYSFFFLIMSISMFFSSMFFISMDLSIMLEFSFFSFNSCSIMMTLLFDWKSLLFSSFVFFISSMVVFYSDEYMHGDLNLNRFIILVSLFVCSMMLLIFSPNLISILLGWDGLGLVSYCLVIYYQNIKSYNAGMLTALSNRVGDVALLISIAWMMNFGSWNYIFWLECMKQDFHMVIISYLIVLAAMTKSAQIPFSSWLPAAMAAPTPVSSLVHSSTLVTAGVYLLIRFSPCFSSNLYLFLLLISSLTMFMAGLGANFEFDLKKIIALSTLSQLGLMMGILAIGESNLAFFHLLTHALFKALLFMCAGNIIHNLLNCQDIRFMGGLVVHMPLTCTFFNICNMALCGIPFLAGFYSKDLMLEVLSMNYVGLFTYLIFFISTGLTVSYSVRLAYYTMMGDNNFLVYSSLSESSFTMLKGMMGLIFFVIMGGSMLSWLIFSTPYFICLPFLMKIMALIVTFLGVWFGYELSMFSFGMKLFSISYLKMTLFTSLMWNLPFISTFGINYYPVYFGGQIYQKLDNGWLEYFGGKNFYQNMKNMSGIFNFFYNNNLKINLMLFIFLLIIIFMI